MLSKSSLLPTHAEAATNQSFVSWINPVDGSLLRVIPAGEFVMGSTATEIDAAKALDPDGPLFPLQHEMPQFRAHVPSFSIGVHTVTNQQFAQFLSDVRPSAALRVLWIPDCEQILVPSGGDDYYCARAGFERHPAIHISWFGAEAYCRWAGLRLPTEMEWEKAARGADGRVFPWGNEWEPEALCWWGSHCGDESTASVNAFFAGCSPYGLFQMAGNVEEWCTDWYQARVYERYAAGDLELPRAGMGRILRGGNALRKERLAFRCAMRRANRPAFVNIVLTGIRCASSIVPDTATLR